MTNQEIHQMIEQHKKLIADLEYRIDMHRNSINALEGELRHRQIMEEEGDDTHERTTAIR